jgi:hypothetical protein
MSKNHQTGGKGNTKPRSRKNDRDGRQIDLHFPPQEELICKQCGKVDPQFAYVCIAAGHTLEVLDAKKAEVVDSPVQPIPEKPEGGI